MTSFRIIPVIDILKGKAVHAKKGLRNIYEPVKTVISTNSNVLDIIKAFENRFSFKEVYIADLDSIIKEKPNLQILRKVIDESNLKIMIDPGIRNNFDVLQFKILKLNKLILATETIDSLSVIDEAIKQMDEDNIIISIDMKEGKLLARSPEIKKMNIIEIIKIIYEKGIREIIFLDLTKVGMKTGCYNNFYGEIKKEFPELSILLGGGVKDCEDMEFLKEKGISGVLVATIIHDGSLKTDDIKRIMT